MEAKEDNSFLEWIGSKLGVFLSVFYSCIENRKKTLWESKMVDCINKIAVIGFSGAFPGVDNAYDLWNLTSTGSLGIKKSNQDQIAKNLPDDIANNTNFIPFGGGPSNFKNFDASFFGYSPKEAKYLDPQMRKALEYSWHAFEHAGYCPNGINVPVGVYIASSVNFYFIENLRNTFHGNTSEYEKNQILFLNEPDFLATRISHNLNLKGPAFTLKCGCSSSLVSVHHACSGLNNFDCDIALAGGVAIKPRYHYGYIYEQGGIMSNDGYCRPFSDDASGTVFANGIGLVILKRLSDAIDDGDQIYGVIRSSFTNNDGNDKVGYMAPSISGQMACMETALAYAELEPKDIQYIEAHGTGTKIGDPIEYKGLEKIFARSQKNSVALSSVKSNIGHLDAASGIAGFIKVLLDLENKTISPIANFRNPNPELDDSNSPIELVRNLKEWCSGDKGRIAIISSFGIGGTNVNIVLEEYLPQKTNTADYSKDSDYLFTFSAKSPVSLIHYINNFKNYFLSHPEVNLRNLSYTLLIGRRHFNYRYAVIASNVQELLCKLEGIEKDLLIVVNKYQEISLTNDNFNNPKSLINDWLQGAMITNLSVKIDGCHRIAAPLYQFADYEFWIYMKKEGFELNEKITDVSQWFYIPDWKATKIPENKIDISYKNVLILSSANQFCSEFISTLTEHGAKVINVCVNDFDITKKENWISFWHKLKEADHLPEIVVHTWCLTDQKNEAVFDFDTLGIFSLMYLYQASIQIIGDVPLLTIIVANHLFNISGCEYIEPLKTTLLGISQVLPKERENAACQLIDIDLSTPHHFYINSLLQEIAYRKSCEVAFRQTKRFIRSYSKINLAQEYLGNFTIKADKNYLILGGLGNFGMELAEFIGVLHKGNVFLTSRMNFPQKEMWDEWLKQKGTDNFN
ncbi:beta-ketoacyl synthase N-terminal-like domain-containing protein [Wolbachia endosymbiont (group A) of Myopa testacea]|uniref:beta-ketoacyl synthase N-terminal-like domain-containing protein n=1 Tax=Wolbachia endosymbiont (group A) of Myopa testacea TaxID=3066148 RepID=UPI003132CAD4